MTAILNSKLINSCLSPNDTIMTNNNKTKQLLLYLVFHVSELTTNYYSFRLIFFTVLV